MNHWKYALLFCAVGISPALAQSTVITQSMGLTTNNASASIVSGGTYQSIWAADTNTNRGRQACTIINNGTHSMYVFAGPIASATNAKSVILAANQAFYCNTPNGVLKDQISIDGTTADAFYAAIQ